MPFSVFKLFIFIPKDLLVDSKSSINKDIMNFFSIDCSTDIGSLFIKIKNKAFIKNLQSDKLNIDLLMKQILSFFKENNLKFDDISQIYVNQGPGNFSGLRGSIATAQGICLSQKINLFGYNTFLWSCAKYFNKNDTIYSLVEFRERYFLKKFEHNLKSVSNIEEITEQEIINNYNNKFKVIPKNMVKYFSKKILKLKNLNIEDLNHKELEFLQLKGLLNKNLIKPMYLS
jgi:tRNA threonylcarbamoyl adenosine modification protein YeaZ